MTEYYHVHIPSDLVFTVNPAERNRPMGSDSDRGRFGYDFVNRPGRIREPLLRRDGKLEPVSKEQALDHLRSLLGKEARIIGIGSPRASLEANFALYALVGAERFYSGMSAADHRLVSLILEILRDGPARAASVRDAEQADAVLVLGESVNGRQSWRLTAKPGRCSRGRTFPKRP